MSYSLDAADINGDGYPEMLGRYYSSEVRIYDNQAGSISGSATVLLLVGTSPSVISVGDIDGDGSLDILSPTDSGVYYYPNPAYDPLDPDMDDDGLLDGFEEQHGFDPLIAGEQTGDPDGDGLANDAEQAAGTNPHASDSDADGYSDPEELQAGSDPTDPASYPGSTSVPGLGIVLRGVLALMIGGVGVVAGFKSRRGAAQTVG